MTNKICLDAGHYGKYNQSPCNNLYYESEMTWKLHLLQKKYLELYGFEVVTTRTNQATDKGVYERGTCSKGCDLFISNHSNAVGSCRNESVDYPVVFVPLNGKGNDIGEKLADLIASVMETSQKGRIATREGSNGDYYGVINGAVSVSVVGILAEHSFHTNTKMTNWLLDDVNLDKLAKAEAGVIAEYFGVPTKITGIAEASATQMISYIKAKNSSIEQSILDMIPLYLSEGKTEGIRGDIAFAQSCLETGNFLYDGTAVTPGQNNFCGMGVTSNGLNSNCFDTPQLGIRAQIQHLKAYANNEALVSDCVDPRFYYVTRGCAKYVEWLGQQENPNGKGWAVGTGYGKKVIDILNNILNTNDNNSSIPNASDNFTPYLVKVTANTLNIRKGPGTNYDVASCIKDKGTYTITDETEGPGASKWGKLKSGAGWISLDYTTKASGSLIITPTAKEITTGGKVKVKKAITYTGGTFKTYYDVYNVIQVSDNRVIIGIGSTITAAVHKDNLEAV